MNDILLALAENKPNDIITNDLTRLMKNTSGWSLDATYGWSSQKLSTTPADLLDADGLYLDKIKQVSVVLNSYYNTPNQSMHYNFINIAISDGRVYQMGTSDAWIDAGTQLRLVTSYTGVTTMAGNIINREFVYDVPAGLHITSIGLQSARMSGYVSGVRGMKDFKLTY